MGRPNREIYEGFSSSYLRELITSQVLEMVKLEMQIKAKQEWIEMIFDILDKRRTPEPVNESLKAKPDTIGPAR